jgi:hypothetical protein
VSRSESCYREGERSSLLSSCLEVNLEKKKKKFFFDTFSRFLSEWCEAASRIRDRVFFLNIWRWKLKAAISETSVEEFENERPCSRVPRFRKKKVSLAQNS